MGEHGNAAGHGFEEADAEDLFGGGVDVEIHGLIDGGHGIKRLVFEDSHAIAEFVVGVAFDECGVVGGGTGEEEMEGPPSPEATADLRFAPRGRKRRRGFTCTRLRRRLPPTPEGLWRTRRRAGK